MAFPTGWTHKVAITIAASDIDGDLTDWTLVFDQSFDSVLTQVDGPLDADGTRASIDGGGDVRFSSDSAGNTQLAVDVRRWDTDNNPANALCEVAVKIPTVSSSVDTTIYMWWGKSGETQPGAATTYGQYNAYDSDYELVYPLSENSGSRFDRTSNQETLTPNSTPTAVDGVVGNANSFDGLNDYLYSGTSNPIEGGNTFTVECWSKAPRSQPNGYTDASIVTLAAAGAASDALGFWCDAASPPTSGSGRSNLVAWFVAGERIESDNGQWTDDTWEHFAGTSSSTTLKLLIDGVEVTDSPKSVTIGSVRSNTRFLVAAWDFDLDRYERNGEIDELRISSTVRANAWIAANYDNQRNKTGFLTWGTIQDIVAGSDDLTATDIVSATVINVPTLGQIHELTGSNLASNTVIDIPTLEQVHNLIGVGSTVLSEIDAPQIGQVHNLTGVDLAIDTVIDTLMVGQVHQLTGTDLASLTIMDVPVLTELSGVDNLTGQDLIVLSEINTPTFAQIHNLAGQGLIVISEIDTPTFVYNHDLAGAGLLVISEINTPTLQEVSGQDNLTGVDLEVISDIDTPTLGQVHKLTSVNLAVDTEIDTPTLTNFEPGTEIKITTYNLMMG